MVDDVENIARLVCLIDLIRAISIREQGHCIAIFVDSIVKLSVIHWFIDKFDVESSRCVW